MSRSASPLQVVTLETPGAGPSRRSSPVSGASPPKHAAPLPDPLLDEDEEDADRELFLRRQKEYTDLEQSVEASSELLTSLASYLTTFQDNLSDVSGQIADLQQRSDEIERQLKGRRVILPPLNALLSDLIIPTSLVLTIRDTEPAANPGLWLQAVAELEEKMVAVKSRGAKVKAARELEGLIEALVLKTMHALPPFLLTLIRPLRSASKGLSTNLAVMQTSFLLKYQPFYAFLLRQSPRQAKQVERGYVNAARSYYETAMRRYARALSLIRARTPQTPDLIGVVSSEEAANAAAGGKTPQAIKDQHDQLEYADMDIDGENGPVILAYQADDKDMAVPVAALFRSLGLVLLDNASAEFTFIVRFFARASLTSPAPPPPEHVKSPTSAPGTPIESPALGPPSDAGRSRRPSGNGNGSGPGTPADSLRDAERIWNEVFSSALDYCTQFFQGVMSPTPPNAVTLLTMIRLNDRLLATADKRGTLPLVSFLTGWKMQLWPAYRRAMDQQVDSLRALADQAEGKGLAGYLGKGVKDGTVRAVAARYAAMFASAVVLADEAEDQMVFSSMSRLRTELVRLITTQANKLKDGPGRHTFLAGVFEVVMRELVAGPGAPTHPRLQSELSFFRTREEEARRRISTSN